MTAWLPDPAIAEGQGFLRGHEGVIVALAHLDSPGRWRAWARGPSQRWRILPDAATEEEAQALADAVLAEEWPDVEAPDA